MKKLIPVILAAVLVLIACAAAFANNTAVDLFDRTADLLFHRDSLTLNATAEFSLDDQWFKTAEIVLKQDGNRAFRKLHLRSPKADGTDYEAVLNFYEYAEGEPFGSLIASDAYATTAAVVITYTPAASGIPIVL